MKECKNCGIEKSLSKYYKHKQMRDGHLNKCKECVKKRISDYWRDGRGKIVDKRRNKKPARKEWKRLYSKRMNKKYYKKKKCRSIFWRKFKKGLIKKLPCEKCNTQKIVEAHHTDYNKPFDVMWLCCLHHKEWHRNNKAIQPK